MSDSPAVERTLAGRPTRSGRLVLAQSAAATTLLLGGLGLLAVAVYILLGRRIATPWIMVDEWIYAELGKGVADHGRLLVRDESMGHFSFLYPILIAPAWLASSMETTYSLAKAINAVLMALTAVPVYLWARRLMAPTYALVTTLLTLLLPAMLYSGMLMTENAFLPAFVLGAYAIALALERPTLPRQALVLGAIGLTASVRLQGLVLIPILVTAIVVDGLLDRSSRGTVASLVARVRAFKYSLVLVGLAAAAYWLFRQARDEPLSAGLGSYRVVGEADYALQEILRWSLYHAAELCLALGLVPVSAFLVLLVIAAWRGTSSAAERAFLAVTASATVWLVVMVAAFVSRFISRIEERNLFYLAPLFLIALGLWLSRGAPRPRAAALVAAATPAVLIFYLPLTSFLNGLFLSDTFAFVPLDRLAVRLEGGAETVESIVVAAAFAAAALFVVLPRVLVRALVPAAIAVFFVLTSFSVSNAIRAQSINLRGFAFRGDGDWIDDKIGPDADAVYLFGGAIDPNDEFARLWQTEFWNRSVGTVYRVGDAEYSGFPEVDATADLATGAIRTRGTGEPIRSTYAVTAAPGFELAGELAAENSRLSLYRVTGEVALASTVIGVYGDGWMGSSAAYARFATPGGRPGRVRVFLSRKGWKRQDVPGRVRIRVGPSSAGVLTRVTAEQRWVIHRLSERTFTLATPRPPFRVEVSVDPTFSPSSFGLTDSRQLGAVVGFAFVPGLR